MDTANFKGAEFNCPCGCGLQAQDAIILAMQVVRSAWGKPMHVDCGARCPQRNIDDNGADDSAHLVGLAADIADIDGSLKAWIAPRLQSFGLWMESPDATSGWAHLQVRPAVHRIFQP